MAEYTNEQLLELLEKEGMDTSKFGQELNRPESMETRGLEDTVPHPLHIMQTAHSLGYKIPWAGIAVFLMCVVKKVWKTPLKDAIKECAGLSE
jgi:hypothetical protein